MLSLPLVPWFTELVDIPQRPASRPRQSVLIVTLVTVAVTLPTKTSFAVLRGLQRFDLLNAVSVVGAVGSAVAMVLLLLAGAGVVAITAVTVVAELVAQVPLVWLIHRAAPELRPALGPRPDTPQDFSCRSARPRRSRGSPGPAPGTGDRGRPLGPQGRRPPHTGPAGGHTRLHP